MCMGIVTKLRAFNNSAVLDGQVRADRIQRDVWHMRRKQRRHTDEGTEVKLKGGGTEHHQKNSMLYS